MRRIYFDDGNQTTTGMNQMMKTVINAEDTKQRANLPSSPRQGTPTRFKSRRAPKKTKKKQKECLKEQKRKKKPQLGEKGAIHVRHCDGKAPEGEEVLAVYSERRFFFFFEGRGRGRGKQTNKKKDGRRRRRLAMTWHRHTMRKGRKHVGERERKQGDR